MLDASSGSPEMEITQDDEDWECVAVDQQGRLVAAGTSDGTVCLWEVPSRTQRFKGKLGADDVDGLGFTRGGAQLIARVGTPSGNEVRLIDATKGTLLHVFAALAPAAFALSPDGEQLAFDSQNDVLVWDIDSREAVHRLVGHTNTVRAITYSPDQRWIASAGGDRNVRIWDASSGQLRSTMTGHRDDIELLAFSADARTLASADRMGSLKLWHMATGRELLELDRQPIPLERIAFSPDGNRFASLLETGVLRILHVPQL
jgi:WD40 repeat protein